jgi:hypothetical protein
LSDDDREICQQCRAKGAERFDEVMRELALRAENRHDLAQLVTHVIGETIDHRT